MSDPEPKRVRQPRPLWAALLSLVFPGLGQIYVGALRLGVILFVLGLASHLLLFGFTRVAAPEPAAVAAFLILALIGILYRLATAIAAFRLMRRGFEGETSRRWYQSTWIAAIAMVALTYLTNALIAPSASEIAGWHSYNIPSGSNLPTLRLRDYVMADVSHPGTPPAYGDIVTFDRARTTWVKRVVGLPGDTVQMRGGILHINGRPMPRSSVAGQPRQYRETLPNGRSYVVLEQTDNGPLDNTREFKVPPASFFTLGDNRDDSRDSREFGSISQANFIGVIYTVYWSPDFYRLLLRLE